MHEERMIAERKSRSFGLRLPTNIVDRMDEECERMGISRTQYILSLRESRPNKENSKPLVPLDVKKFHLVCAFPSIWLNASRQMHRKSVSEQATG